MNLNKFYKESADVSTIINMIGGAYINDYADIKFKDGTFRYRIIEIMPAHDSYNRLRIPVIIVEPLDDSGNSLKLGYRNNIWSVIGYDGMNNISFIKR